LKLFEQRHLANHVDVAQSIDHLCSWLGM